MSSSPKVGTKVCFYVTPIGADPQSRVMRLVLGFIALLILTACGGGSGSSAASAAVTPPPPTDDTAAVQAAVDTGGIVVFAARTYHLTRGITITKSGTTIVGQGPSTVFEYTPPSGALTRCETDRVFTTPCAFDYPPPRQVAAPINVGDTSFEAALASDVADLQPSDWVLINDYDEKIGDRVAVDWVLVASVDGTTVTVTAPFRMAFTTARAWNPGHNGLGFTPIKPLVQNVEYRNFSVVVDATNTHDVGGVAVYGALHTTIDNVTVTDPIGQPFYCRLCKDLTITNSTANGGTILSELASTVDLSVTGNHFSSDSPGFGLDLGTGYFIVSGNSVNKSANAGVYFLYGVHDGTVSGNQIAYVDTTTEASASGMLIWGSQNITVKDNNLAGGTGPNSVGIDVRPYQGELLEPDVGVNLSANTFGSWVTNTEQN